MWRSAAAAMAFAAACAAAVSAPGTSNATERLRPLHSESIAEAPRPSYAHMHASRREARDVRTRHVPSAPAGAEVAVLSEVPRCDCAARALTVEESARDFRDDRDATDTPVEWTLQGGVVWAWIPRQAARGDWAYRIVAETDPAEALISDPTAEILGGEAAGFELAGPVRSVRLRVVDARPVRYTEVPR